MRASCGVTLLLRAVAGLRHRAAVIGVMSGGNSSGSSAARVGNAVGDLNAAPTTQPSSRPYNPPADHIKLYKSTTQLSGEPHNLLANHTTFQQNRFNQTKFMKPDAGWSDENYAVRRVLGAGELGRARLAGWRAMLVQCGECQTGGGGTVMRDNLDHETLLRCGNLLPPARLTVICQQSNTTGSPRLTQPALPAEPF